MSIPGSPPSLLYPPLGCRFHARCAYVMEGCRHEPPPPLAPIGTSGHLAACHLDQATRDVKSSELSTLGAAR